MVHNIKTDVVYYKTNTDFEMEFNLCGCCLMRLLTDKALDKKTFIASLSRAVARSRVILVVGALFGEDNITENVSCAIGKSIVFADNQAYGINSSEQIAIIEGSTPLVTEDGIFGGCIIESGPQTMILLSESKNIRKSIMNSLIHPYIKDIYSAETEGDVISEETEELSEELVIEPEEETEENIEGLLIEPIEEEEEPEDEIIGDIIIPEDKEYFEEDYIPLAEEEIEEMDLFTEPQKMAQREVKHYNEAYSDFEVDDAGLVGSVENEFGDYSDYGNYEDDGFYVSPPYTKIAVIIISILILLGLGALAFLVFYLPSKDGVSAVEYVKNIYNTLFK